MTAIAALFWMLVGHALADYPLQGEFLAQAKNRHTPIGAQFWPWALGAHALIHGGAVAGAVLLATPGAMGAAILLGLCEAAVHAWTDFLKCDNHLTLHEDQLVHIAAKFCWALVVLMQS